jgi:hypothetical protein
MASVSEVFEGGSVSVVEGDFGSLHVGGANEVDDGDDEFDDGEEYDDDDGNGGGLSFWALNGGGGCGGVFCVGLDEVRVESAWTAAGGLMAVVGSLVMVGILVT